MPKASVTYKAPKGDAKVCTLFGHTFHDGKAEEIEVDDATLEKLKNNMAFEVGGHAKDAKQEPKGR